MPFYKRFFLIFFCIFLGCGVFAGVFFSNKENHHTERIGSLTLTDSHGTIITNKGLADGYMKPYAGALTVRVIQDLLRIEDARYWEHSGVDVLAKLASIRDNLSEGSVVRGGSTITEQYIKNRYYSGEKRTIVQKSEEALFALYLSLTEDKETLLRKYLNTLYFGNRIYGIQTAIELLYNKNDLSTLSPDEIIDLIARVRLPNVTKANKTSYDAYKNFIAEKLGYIHTQEFEIPKTTYNYYTNIFPILTTRIEEELTDFCNGQNNSLQTFTQQIPQGICKQQNRELTLSIDAGIMRYTTDVVQSTLQSLDKEHVSAGAIYILDPKTHTVLAYTSETLGPGDTDIDMIQRERSVGSLLKPFIYLLALQEGAEIDDFILDEESPYPTGHEGQYFIPKNYSEKTFGPIRLKQALGSSLNASTVRLVEHIGLAHVYSFLKNIGLGLSHDVGYYGYGIALGTVELSLENVVQSYMRLLTPENNTWLIQNILSDERNRALSFGVSSILNTSIPIAVKTGTSTDFRDNWTVSYTPDVIIGVWVGNPDGSQMKDVSGVSGAGGAWKRVTEHLIQRGIIQKVRKDIPSGVYETYFCLDVSCLKKEKTWQKKQKVQTSFPENKIFFTHDFLGNITENEKEKWGIRD